MDAGGLRATLDLLPVGLAHFAADGTFLLVNQRMCDLLGLKREDLLTKTFQEVSFPGDLQGCLKLNAELAAGSIPRYVHEKRFVRGDGSVVWTRVTVTAARDPNGSLSFFVGVAEDITAEHRAEQARRAAEERLHLALRAADVGTFRWDLTRDVLEGDETLQRLFALSPAEARSTKAFLARIHPEDRARLEQAAARSAEGAEIDEEFRIVLPDGTQRWIRDRARTIRADDGSPVCVTGACADVTVRRELDQELRREQRRFRTLANAIPQLAWMADANGRRNWVNQRWVDYTASGAEQVSDGIADLRWRELQHPEHADRVLALEQGAVARGVPWEETHPLRAKDGTYRWFLSRALPLTDEAGTVVGWLGTCTDITALMDAERERRMAFDQERAALAAAERAVRARDEAMAILAHDLRNPLHAIVLASAVARGASLDQVMRERQLTRINRSATAMDRLISDLLDVSRIDAGTLVVHKAPVDVRSLLEQTVDMFAEAASSAEVSLVHEMASAAGIVVGDQERLRQVLANLMGNALKFTSAKGRVSVSARPEEGRVTFAVEDTGAGMGPEQLAHAFDRFWKADRATRSGAGLGLAIAKGIVDAHGGRIWIESTVGRGTKVAFTIPAAA